MFIFRAAIVAIVVVVGACSKDDNRVATLSSQGQLLAHYLSKVTLADPSKDVDNALARNDHRFLGINGLTCTAPAVPETLIPENITIELNCIPGTSDMIILGEESLTEKVRAYAEAYNRELLARLTATSPNKSLNTDAPKDGVPVS